jgi:PTS system cellobiose-specific IIC component
MNGLITFLEQKVSPIAAKIGGQRHMLAVRKGIISTLPLTLVGSFFVIFLNFPIPAVAEKLTPYLAHFGYPLSLYGWYSGTLCNIWDRKFAGSEL